MNAFQARGTNGSVIAPTAKEAAILFFAEYPKARKCDINEGTQDGRFFEVAYGRNVTTLKLKDVTKKMIDTL